MNEVKDTHVRADPWRESESGTFIFYILAMSLMFAEILCMILKVAYLYKENYEFYIKN